MVLSCCRLDPQIHGQGQTVVPGCSGETAEGRKHCLPLYIWREKSKVHTVIEAKKARAHGISSENMGDKKTLGKPSAQDPGGPAESLFLSRWERQLTLVSVAAHSPRAYRPRVVQGLGDKHRLTSTLIEVLSGFKRLWAESCVTNGWGTLWPVL